MDSRTSVGSHQKYSIRAPNLEAKVKPCQNGGFVMILAILIIVVRGTRFK